MNLTSWTFQRSMVKEAFTTSDGSAGPDCREIVTVVSGGIRETVVVASDSESVGTAGGIKMELAVGVGVARGTVGNVVSHPVVEDVLGLGAGWIE